MKNFEKLYVIFPEKISSKPTRGIYEASNIRIINESESGANTRYLIRVFNMEFTVFWDNENDVCLNESSPRNAMIFVDNESTNVVGSKMVIVAFDKERAFNYFRTKLERDKNEFELRLCNLNHSMEITTKQLEMLDSNPDDVIVLEENA